jgi:hypothetical protein
LQPPFDLRQLKQNLPNRTGQIEMFAAFPDRQFLSDVLLASRRPCKG